MSVMHPMADRAGRQWKAAFSAVLVGSICAGPTCWAQPAEDGAGAWEDAHFPIETIAPQQGWAAEDITPDQWQPIEQADLAQQIAAAPELTLVDVAPPPERCWVGHQPYLVPNPDGQSWDGVFPYFNRYRGQQEVVIHDFGTGETRKQVLSTGEGDTVLTRESIGFHMQPSYYADGKLVFAVYGPVLFAVYDPAENAFVHGSKPFGNDVINGRCVLGEDGMIYGMGWPRDKSGFVAYRFDPKTYETKRYETFGPPNEHRQELYREVRMSGDWLYAAIGNQPWHLVALNVKTGEGRLLATTEEIRGSGRTIGMQPLKGGMSGVIHEAAFIDGVDDFDKETFNFWLHDGRIVPRDGDVPPWSDSPAEDAPSASFAWDREFQQWPSDFTPPSTPIEFQRDAADPDSKGHVELPWRHVGESEWQILEYDVQMYPGVVQLLTEVNDHVLFATDSGYGQHVFYNLRTNQVMRVGGTMSPYSMGLHEGRLYVSGYPSSQMYEYDFTRPLGLKQDEPNPRRVAIIGSHNDTHNPMAGTLGGADGRIYSAGTTYGRQREGGGFGWYDTTTGESGGTPIDGHRIFWSTTADDARYFLLSSKLGGEGELFCWDTQRHTFIYQKQIFDEGRPGPIAEALPGGLVIGHHDSGALYGLHADTGEVLWRKDVGFEPVTGFSAVRTHKYTFRRGPDGHIWTFFGDTLVRIDPTNAEVKPVGRLAQGPQQIAFSNNAVYVAGGDRLRRIEGIDTSTD